MKLTTAVASIALVGVAHAVDVPQSEDKLINYVNYIEECELTCWKKSTKAMGCEMTDFNCFCKNAGSNYIGQATMCAFDACDNAFALQFDMGAMCSYYQSTEPNGIELEDAKNRLAQRLSNVTDVFATQSATPTKSGASATKPAGTSSSKGSDKPSSAGVVGTSVGFLAAAAIFATFL